MHGVTCSVVLTEKMFPLESGLLTCASVHGVTDEENRSTGCESNLPQAISALQSKYVTKNRLTNQISRPHLIGKRTCGQQLRSGQEASHQCNLTIAS